MYPEKLAIQRYYVLVRIAQDHFVSEWSGNLTLTTQRDGEGSLELAFADQPASWIIQDKTSGWPVISISID